MKQLSTLLQNAIEDYLKQLDKVTLTDLKEICEFNLSDIAFKAIQEVQNSNLKNNSIPQEKVFNILTRAGNTLLGFPVGERINALRNLQGTALNYGYKMFYGINEEPYMCYTVQHTQEDNYQIVAVGFVKNKK